MKKVLIAFIAVVLLAPALPAAAGDFSASGIYRLDGIVLHRSGTGGTGLEDSWYENEFNLITQYQLGNATAVVGLKVVGDSFSPFNWPFDRPLAGPARLRNNASGDIVDFYYLLWKPSDELAMKTGQYRLQWGRMIAVYAQGGYNIGATYGLDDVELGLTVGKVREGTYLEPATGNTHDADIDQFLLSAGLKGLGPIRTFDLFFLFNRMEKGNYSGFPWFVSRTEESSLLAGVMDLPVSLLDLSGEFGFFGGKDYFGSKVHGNYWYLDAGIGKSAGFRLSAVFLLSSKVMYTGFGENFAPLELFANRVLDVDNANLKAFWLKGSYDINDKLTVGGTVAPYLRTRDKAFSLFVPPFSSYNLDKIGYEVDARATYKFSDKVAYEAAAGYFKPSAEGKAVFGFNSIWVLRHAITFLF